MNIYTREQWAADRNFNAATGQEIEAEIYEEMFNVMPPLRLVDAQGCTAGFRVSEPYTHRGGKPLYRAFGKRDGKYYYLGLQQGLQGISALFAPV